MHENCSIFTIIFSLFGRKKENPSTCWIFSVSFPQNLYGHQTMPKLSKKVSFGCPFIKKMEFFFMQKAFFWFFENRWDELALTSSAYNSLVFINILFPVFLFYFDLCFEKWKTKVPLLASKNISGRFSDGLSFGWTPTNAHLSHFWVFRPLKMVKKYFFPKKNLTDHDCQYLSFEMRYYFSKLLKNSASY